MVDSILTTASILPRSPGRISITAAMPPRRTGDTRYGNYILIAAVVSSLSIILLTILYYLLHDDTNSRSIGLEPTIKIPLFRSIVDRVGDSGQPAVNYFALVSIGTRGIKQFKIQFDTSLKESFVPLHDKGRPGSVLHYDRGYMSANSSTSKQIGKGVRLEYQQCKMDGDQYQDLIDFDNALPRPAGKVAHSFLAVKNVQVGCPTNFGVLEVDGSFGLAPDLTNSLLDRLVHRRQFSFWFNPALDARDGGELTIGEVDPNRYQGSIIWHVVPDMTGNQWALNLQNVTIGAETLSGDCRYARCGAIINTGVSDIYGPAPAVQRIHALVRRNSDVPLIDCQEAERLPVLTFFIGGQPYSLTPANYVRRLVTSDASKCYVAVWPIRDTSVSNQSRWILGTNFLSAYYSVFDMDARQVGFATMRT